MTQTIILRGQAQRDLAKRIIDAAGPDFVVTVSAPKRSTDQNAKLWAMLSDVSRAKPDDRAHNPETWKALFMNACGHATRFEVGLEGEPFPVGFRSSRLSKKQMSDLIEFVYAYGTQRGVMWSESMPDYSA
jgi:hypothetical protein